MKERIPFLSGSRRGGIVAVVGVVALAALLVSWGKEPFRPLVGVLCSATDCAPTGEKEGRLKG